MPDVLRQRLRRSGSLLAGFMLLVSIVTAACGGEDGRTLRPVTPAVETEVTVPVASTALPPPEGSNRFLGSATAGDPTGDTGGTGQSPPGIDLTGARIVSSKGNLVLIWYTAEKAESRIDAGATAAWTFELSNGDQPAYDITFRLTGKDWDILVLDRATGEETKHRIGSIYRDRLDVPYPARQLDKLQPAFTWTARSHYTDASGATWSDIVPDDGGVLPYPN